MAHTTRAAAMVLATIVGAALGVAPAAQATTNLTATDIRIGDHPAFVRAVVEFTDGNIPRPSEMLRTSDAEPFADGVAIVRLDQRGVRTEARTTRAEGVTVRVIQRRNGITIRLAAATQRFKYVSYFSLPNPERLVIDLWKSAPPSRAAAIRRAPSGCLTLSSYDVSRRRVTVTGTERDLFEHAFVVRLRAADGRVLAQQPVTGGTGRWTSSFRYPRVRQQPGTLEAVAGSAKDCALVCLVQVKIRIGS
jgi:hypothetical protein